VCSTIIQREQLIEQAAVEYSLQYGQVHCLGNHLEDLHCAPEKRNGVDTLLSVTTLPENGN